MNIVTLDFETYYDQDYTLKKLTTEAYVRDPRFEVLGVGARTSEGKLYWQENEPGRSTLDDFFQHLDIENSALLCHHAHFDGLILSHHYGVRPRAWLDTLSMGRLLLGNHLPLGLDALARHFGLQGKSIDYASFRGKRWHELAPDVQRALADGCLWDISLTWDIFGKLMAMGFPQEELAIVDMTVRLFTEPTLVGDVEALGKVWSDEQRRKQTLLEQLGVDQRDLQSAARFVALLRSEGIEPPVKPGKSGDQPCIAKTDSFMKSLLDHPNDRVRLLAEARLGVKSTGDQTRAERLGYMATRGPLTMYLGYCGAHTTRWVGGDGSNPQNWRRGGAIRKAIKAPEGHKIIKADKSQVEARYLDYLAGQQDSIERFRAKQDPYTGVASAYYGEPIEPKDPRRNLGKVIKLACGFGMGWFRLQETCRIGPMGLPPIPLTEDEARRGIHAYRSTHPCVVDYWKQAEWAMQRMADGLAFSWSKFHFKDGKVWLPNGAPLLYPDMKWGPVDGGEPCWSYQTRKGRAGVWGGFFVENLIQAISRVDISQTLLRIKCRAPHAKLVNLEHDAAIYVDTVANAEQTAKIVEEEFSRSPVWLPDIPLSCDVYIGERYA